jgi:hypothetical protein
MKVKYKLQIQYYSKEIKINYDAGDLLYDHDGVLKLVFKCMPKLGRGRL